MILRKVMLSLILAGVLGAAATASADAPKSQCVFHRYGVTLVQPVSKMKRFGHFESPQLAGARVFVPARPGLTSQWIQRTLDAHRAAMNGHPMAGCPMAVESASARVVADDSGFWVEITSDNGVAAQRILERARSLVQDRPMTVEHSTTQGETSDRLAPPGERSWSPRL